MALKLRLDVDADRDGIVGDDEPGRGEWGWGPGTSGAVVAVDVDLDGFHRDDAALLRLTADGTPRDDETIVVSLNDASAQHVTLWSDGADGPVALAGALAQPSGRPVSPPLPVGVHELRLQAHFFADGTFDGLVQVFAEVRVGGRPRGVLHDRVLVRVAPWIMPTSLDAPELVYVVALPDPRTLDTNLELLVELGRATRDLGIAPPVEIPGNVIPDVWIQDEIEFGYSHVPANTFRHVVVDGPRNRGLDVAAEKLIADADVGFYEIAAQQQQASSLDSFGNLEVAPPVPEYPLGRVVLGTKRRLERGRRMSLEVRQFLYSQLVQPVLEIYTDWLAVGHVDEIIAFEPDSERPHGFRLLIASPRRFRGLLERCAADGHGDAELWSGRVRIHALADREVEIPAAETVRALLDRTALWAYNDMCAGLLAEIRDELVAGLGLTKDDVVEVPVAFRRYDDYDGDGVPNEDSAFAGEDRAIAYFPDMVNHLILGPISIVPRPYGPRIDGVDLLEQDFLDACGHTRDVRFADDWITYHEASGEIHCGTNVRRTPTPPVPWWHTQPERGWDASFRASP